MKRNVIIYRFQFNPTTNERAAIALREFYMEDPQKAFVIGTPYGLVTNMLTPATAEQIFTKLTNANIGNEFMVIELDANGNPIKTLTSVGANVSVGETVQATGEMVDHALLDSLLTEDQLEAEMSRLLDRIHAVGLQGLTAEERSRLDHLSQR